MRIGHGYDVHRFADNCLLVIGGVTIPHTQGLEAHSDGDVLIHAICDALLGAAGWWDIGHHFPDNDMAYAGLTVEYYCGVFMMIWSRQAGKLAMWMPPW